jgi:hypothetical protein
MRAKNNLYLYLARLDKKGIKTLCSFAYPNKVYPTRINDLKELNMRPEVSSKISKEADENRMQYELYAESAASFDDLKKSLRGRGYSNLPMQQFTGYTHPTMINKSALITEESTMLRRASRKIR